MSAFRVRARDRGRHEWLHGWTWYCTPSGHTYGTVLDVSDIG